MKVFEVFIKIDDSDDDVDYEAMGMDRPFIWRAAYIDVDATIGYFLGNGVGDNFAIILIFPGHEFYVKYDKALHNYLKEKFNAFL